MSNKKRQKLLDRLRSYGLAYPEAHLKSPWPNHADLAVRDKTFCYLPADADGGPFSISCKLPHSHVEALMLPFTKPTGYGLGRSGWVTLTCEDDALPPAEMLEAWIDESYRAQAPKRLVRTLDEAEPAAPARKKRARKRAAQKK